MFACRRSCRADRAAIDSSGDHAHEQAAIKPCIASLQGAIADLGIKRIHAPTLPYPMENFRPFSDVTMKDWGCHSRPAEEGWWNCQARNGAAVLAFAHIGCWTLLCSVLRALRRIRSSGWASGCSSCDLVEQVTLLDAPKDLASDDLISLLGVMTGPAYVRNTK